MVLRIALSATASTSSPSAAAGTGVTGCAGLRSGLNGRLRHRRRGRRLLLRQQRLDVVLDDAPVGSSAGDARDVEMMLLGDALRDWADEDTPRRLGRGRRD